MGLPIIPLVIRSIPFIVCASHVFIHSCVHLYVSHSQSNIAAIDTCREGKGARVDGMKVLAYAEKALQVVNQSTDVLSAFQCTSVFYM